MPTVLIADDHVLFREGLRALVARWEDFQVVGEAADGEEALRIAEERRPDLVLMDISMPGMDGIAAAQQIKRALPSVHVVMLTASENQEDLFRALQVGADGYVLKDTPSRRLHDLLRGVLRDEAPLSAPMASLMLAQFKRQQEHSSSAEAPEARLTERERAVLELLAQGRTNAEIGQELHLSESTVKKHVHDMLEKLHLASRVEMALYAARSGLIKP
jgi:DNA-binding NarL/FixJ family response regulator